MITTVVTLLGMVGLACGFLVFGAGVLGLYVYPALERAEHRRAQRWTAERQHQDQALALLDNPAPLMVDPRPTLREETIFMTTCGHQWRGRDACPDSDDIRADAPHECIIDRHSERCYCTCGEVGESDPLIMVGRRLVHTGCRDLRTNGRPNEICDGCRPHLLGTASDLPRGTP
jgi:hypothetical protein